MNARDLPEFTLLLTGFCVLYGKPVSEMLIELYWGALESFEFDAVKKAFQAHLSNPDTGQFMPKPADVMRYVNGSSQTRALQAWSKVAEAIRRVGSYASVVFDDPLIHVAIEEMGGWISLCQTLLKDLPFRANEFEKRYAAYVLHPPLHYPKQLIGLEEKENRMNGYAIKPPLLIGNTERALTILQNGCEKPLNVQALNLSLAALSLNPPSENSRNE